MFSRKADGPLRVQIPRPAEDHPRWRRVGVITAIGFVLGVAWPRLAGFRVGPSVPEAASAAAPVPSEGPAAEHALAGLPAPTASPGSAAPPAAVVAPAPSASAAPAVSLSVGHGVVFACKTADGDPEKGSECGTLPGLDGLVMPRLRKLAECPDAVGASGKVHFVVHVDFARGGVGIDLGRGHGVASPDALLACAKTDLAGLAVNAVPHDKPKYSIAYSVTFGGAPGAPASASATPFAARAGGDEGSAQVVWEVAIVRDSPKTGKVITRLQRGAELHLGAPKDGWYPVKFGDGFSSDGWVYRGAIGR
jgi:hypothetical protein